MHSRGATVSHSLLDMKQTAWKIFMEHHELILQLCIGGLTEELLSFAEHFVCTLYKVVKDNTCDAARATLFCKGHAQEVPPSTSDAIQYPIRRAHYQTMD